MTCEQALELMSAALDGEVTGEERRALDEHLANCPHCAALYKELSGQSRLLRELDCDVPSDLSRRILDQLPRQDASPVQPRRSVIHWQRWAALAACAVLAVWAGLLLPFRAGVSSSGSTGSANDAATASGQDDAHSQTQTDRASPNDAAAAPADGQEDTALGGAAAKTASLSAQYIRVPWTENIAPAAQLISSADDLAACLAQFPDNDLTQTAEQYGDTYFDNGGRLIAVTLSESSGSISHTVEAIRLAHSRYEVVIRRSVPQVCTDDMAAWLILVETDQVIGPTDQIVVVMAD